MVWPFHITLLLASICHFSLYNLEVSAKNSLRNQCLSLILKYQCVAPPEPGDLSLAFWLFSSIIVLVISMDTTLNSEISFVWSG